MFRRLLLVLALGFAAFGQTRSRLAEYAVVLREEPVARKVQSRLALRSKEAAAHVRTIRSGQSRVIGELQRRGATIEGATQILVNAIVISASPEVAASAQSIPGVWYVQPIGRLKPALDRALDQMNVSAAWAALGGSAQAGTGMKIGIIDSGIDQNHPGFQDPSLQPPAGFPKGDSGFTNGKVIVARSYVQKDLSPGYYTSSDPADYSIPDDYSPRDRMGHGTAIAMIAAGVQNTGPLGTIQGVAPKAYLGNYKIFGSPGAAAYPNFPAFQDALVDALADGMDVVTLSMNEGNSGTFYPPLANLPECGGDCDVYSVAVENAVKQGMVVVVAAGNDGNVGIRQPTLNTIHRPGGAPSAITVGALMNSHELYQSVKTGGTTYRALFSDGPRPVGPVSGTLKDVASTSGDPLGCSASPAGSLAGAIAVVQRGTCFFSDKINNAQKAGAVGVILYQASGDAITPPTGATDTGIPAVLVGASDGAALKGSGATATLDPAFVSYESTAGTVWPASSHGPSYGDFGPNASPAVKPEIAAIGANLYTATQKYDPNADAYNASGYTGVTGTSYAVPFVAGAVALVKQKHPGWTPAQLKSAVVNTAAQGVTENGSAARVTAVGAGKLDVGAAVNTTTTVSPATVGFGPITTSTVSITKTLTIANAGAAAVTYSVTVQGDADNNAKVAVAPASVSVPAGGTNTVSVALTGTKSAPGNYQGFVAISGGGQTLRVPYLYEVASSIPADIFPIQNGSYVGGVGDVGWRLLFRAIDAGGAPAAAVPVTINITQGGGAFQTGCPGLPGTVCKDQGTDFLGNAGARFNFGPAAGPQVVTGSVQGLSNTVTFDGFAVPYPDISSGGIVNAASNQLGGGVAPGSYVSIYGTNLSDAFHIESTPYLPVSLSDVSVSFDAPGVSQAGRIHFVSAGQVNVQVPWELAGQPSAKVKVTLSTFLPSYTATVPLAQYSPAFFEIAGLAAAQDANGGLITRSHPAARNAAVVLYCNGLGPVSNTPPTGEPSGASPLSQTPATPTVTIGGKQAQVLFSGLTPGVVGLYQINAVLAADTPTGDQQVVVSIGGVTSKASVLPVQ